MYGSTEQQPLVGEGAKRTQNNGTIHNDAPPLNPPTKRFIILILVALIAGIITYLCFWPYSQPVEVIVVDKQLEDSPQGPTASNILHRPICEYWSKGEILFDSATQTSMKEPSKQWAGVACLPVEMTTKAKLEQETNSLFRKSPSDTKFVNPLQVDDYLAPDAILQVNFSQRVFADRPPIYGFGGAFTEASALNFNRLSTAGKDAVMDLLFGKSGLGYSIGRIHINSCDFSVASYSFDDVDGDFDLEEFDMDVKHDVQSGMVDMALRATSIAKAAWGDSADDADDTTERKDGELLLFASPWSPPAWMKNPTWEDEPGATHASQMTYSTMPSCLRDGTGPESAYAASWALYFSKFLTAYAKLGLPFWAVTVQNEPEFPGT